MVENCYLGLNLVGGIKFRPVCKCGEIGSRAEVYNGGVSRQYVSLTCGLASYVYEAAVRSSARHPPPLQHSQQCAAKGGGSRQSKAEPAIPHHIPRQKPAPFDRERA